MNGVIVVAAGTGSRMKKDINKQFIKLNGKEIIAHTINKFYNNDNIDDIVVVIKEEEEKYFIDNIINKYGFDNIKIAYGGNERQDSVYNGIKKLNNNCDVILVHDGARPFVTGDIIKNSIEHTKDKVSINFKSNPIYKEVEIKDNGDGLEEEYIGKIFDRFYRGNTTLRGYGIGLNLSKTIIENHKGEIDARSDRGLIFQIKFYNVT